MGDELDERGFPIAYIGEQMRFYIDDLGYPEQIARVIAEAMYDLDVDLIRILESTEKIKHPSPPYDGSQRKRRYWKKVKFNGP
jgi:hypothetical protein